MDQSRCILLHKIRHAMGERDGRYRLDGVVELDAIFFGPPKEGGGRGCCKVKHKALAGLSFTADGKPRHLKFRVLPRGDRASLAEAVDLMVAPGATVRTNGSRDFLLLAGMGFVHERAMAGEGGIPGDKGWRRVAVSNAKAAIGGTYHGLGRGDGKHLQAYLERGEKASELCSLPDRVEPSRSGRRSNTDFSHLSWMNTAIVSAAGTGRI